MHAHLLQSAGSSPYGTYFWLAACGLVLLLALLSFGYLVVRSRGDGLRRLIRPRTLWHLDRYLLERVPSPWQFVRARFITGEWSGLALTAALTTGFIALYLFVLITESWVEEEALYAFDGKVYDALIGAAGGFTITVMRSITHLGDGWLITAIAMAVGLLLIVRKRKWQVVSLALSVGAGSAMVHGLKWIFGRSRPIEQVVEAVGHSFPSGHAFMATTLYGWLIYLTWSLSRHDVIRVSVTLLLSLLILAVGISRVLLRVHWASDVAGGITLGFAWLACSLMLTSVLRARFAKKPENPAIN